MDRIEVNMQTGKVKVVELSSEEEALALENKAAEEAAKPLKEWSALMAESDTIDLPRWLEDHIESDHAGKSSNPILQGKYDAKKEKRALKP